MSETERKNIDVDISDFPTNEPNDATVSCSEEIDESVDIIITSNKDKKKKQIEEYKQAKKNQIEKEKSDRIAKKKAARKIHKKLAKNYLFTVCTISTIASTFVIGFLIWVAFKPAEWVFVGTIAVIGMINTLLHTYMYRYIREEIYRK